MATRPRILRAVPSGPRTRPDRGIAVVARLRWHDGNITEVSAIATAWTRDAVEVVWSTPQDETSVDWIPVEDVRRFH